jgi:hypothetical protein
MSDGSWRLQSANGSATEIQSTPDALLLVNMSVWSDAEPLFELVYRSPPTSVMGKRRELFERFDEA